PGAMKLARELLPPEQEPGPDRRLDVRQTKALIGRHPRDHARMVAVASHDLGPLGRQPPLRLAAVLLEARHLIPDQKAEPVRPVEPARVLDLLMLPRAAEAERLG